MDVCICCNFFMHSCVVNILCLNQIIMKQVNNFDICDYMNLIVLHLSALKFDKKAQIRYIYSCTFKISCSQYYIMYNHSISGYQYKQLSSVHVHLIDSADLSINDQWSCSPIADCGTRINTPRTINPIAYKHFKRRRYPMLAWRR